MNTYRQIRANTLSGFGFSLVMGIASPGRLFGGDRHDADTDASSARYGASVQLHAGNDQSDRYRSGKWSPLGMRSAWCLIASWRCPKWTNT